MEGYEVNTLENGEALVEVDVVDVQKHLAGLEYPAKKNELILRIGLATHTTILCQIH